MTQTYDPRTIRYHWISAALVLCLWVAGQTIDWFPRGDARSIARSLHIVFGAGLLILLVMRLVWRNSGGTRLPAAAPGLQGRVAVAIHYLLYLMLAVTLLLGLGSVWVRGDSIFWLIKIPAFDPANRELRRAVVELHELLANILLFTSALHAAAALWHHVVSKDEVLQRMWPGVAGKRSKPQ